MKYYLTIEGRRDGYSPDQLFTTCTIGEIIQILEHVRLDYGDIEVILNNDNGYTYGSIDEDSFEVEEFDDDDDDWEGAEEDEQEAD